MCVQVIMMLLTYNIRVTDFIRKIMYTTFSTLYHRVSRLYMYVGIA